MLTDRQLDRMALQMFVIYESIDCEDRRFVPHTDVHGRSVAYPNRSSAAADLYNLRQYSGKRSVKLLKVGPIS